MNSVIPQVCIGLEIDSFLIDRSSLGCDQGNFDSTELYKKLSGIIWIASDFHRSVLSVKIRLDSSK